MALSWFSPDEFRLRFEGPYTARPASNKDHDWPYWMVTASNGVNALSGPEGAVLTDKPTAIEVARRANEKNK